MSDIDPATTNNPMQERLRKLADEWSQGRVSLKQIVGLSTQELYAVASQGYHFFLQGKLQPARVIFEGLVAVDPRNAYYYRALGAIYWREGESQKAIKQFTYAIRVAPRDVSSGVTKCTPLPSRAEVYVANKEFGRARDDLQKAIEKAGPSETALVKKANAILEMVNEQG